MPYASASILSTKFCDTGAPVADTFVLAAKTDTKLENKGRGISAFIVEKDFPGFSIHTIEKKMGSHFLRSSKVILVDCSIPRENLLVEQGDGFKKLMMSFNTDWIENTAICVGRSEFALDTALEYSKQRETFGKPICKDQGIHWMLEEMEVTIKRARLLLYDAAFKESMGKNIAKEAAMAKMNANEEMVQLISDAMQPLGGHGYMEEYKLDASYRDTRGPAFGGGTPPMFRSLIAYELIKVARRSC